MQSFAYILNQRPFRDNSVLLDIFSEDYGRICCVARPAKKRGKILKGSLEPFRYLKIQWIGKGDVQTLTEADERGRHTIPASEMLMGLYLNELILLFTQQHNAQPELFSAYKYTLHKMGDPEINRQILMRFEMYLLSVLGYPLTPYSLPINKKMRYIFRENEGMICDLAQATEQPRNLSHNIYMAGDLFYAIQDVKTMQEKHWKALRQFLDAVFARLSPRKINTRKLLTL